MQQITLKCQEPDTQQFNIPKDQNPSHTECEVDSNDWLSDWWLKVESSACGII